MSGGQAGGASSGASTPSRQPQSQPTSLLSANLAAHLSKPVASSASTSASNVTADTASHYHHTAASPAATNGIRIPLHGTVSHATGGKAPPVAADSAELAIANNDVWKSSAARRAEKAWAMQSEKTLQTDGRFKKHTAAVEKCLATFESVSEWADFIAFLGRLLKTLQSAPHFNAVPRKLIVAKRLSQCLNPALPSGVHQRALEVYEHIFTILGPEGLRRDLSVWSPGLLPFFQFASTTVKPIVLNIIELYYLPLGQDLRPIAKPLQLALLPGLEEETSEHFDRVLKLLDKIKDSIGEPYFLQNLWLILICVPAARLPDIHYLARRLPNLNDQTASAGPGGASSADVTSIVGPDLGLTTRAFSAALEDDSLLVQRAMLDIMVVKLRMDSTTFKNLVRSDDRVSLVQSALGIVLRRDISLNRRLYSWLLGPSEDVDAQQKYFEQHAMVWARLALLTEFNKDDTSEDGAGLKGTTDRQRPYRILISLLDKWSLGLPMTNALIVDTFSALKRQLEASSAHDGSTTSSDVSTTAKMLFEAVDPFALYRQFYYAVCNDLRGDDDSQTTSTSSIIALLRFILSSFRVHDEESRVVHLPTLFAALIELTLQRPDDPRALSALQLAREILILIPKRVFSHRRDDVAVKTMTFVQHGERLYESTSSGADEAAKRYVGFQHPNTIAELLDKCATLPLRNPALAVEALTILCQLLNILDATLDGDQAQAKVAWLGAEWIKQMKPFFRSAKSFIELEACIEVFVAASQCRALRDRVHLGNSDVTEMIVKKLLHHMRSSAGPYHVRSVELLWTVADLAPKTSIGDLLSLRMSATTAQERQTAFDTFGVLWKYSGEARMADPLLVNPLLSILDGLRSTNWLEGQMSERWVRYHAHTYTALIDPLLLMVCDTTCLREPITRVIEGQEFSSLHYRRPLDHEKVAYALSILLQVVHTGGPAMARTLRTAFVQRSIHPALASQASKHGGAETTYASFTTDRLQELLQSNLSIDSPYQAAYQSLLALSVDLLNAVLQKVHPSEQKLQELESVLLQRLLVDIDTEMLTVQGKTLQTLHGIMNLRAAAASANSAAAVAATSASRNRPNPAASQSPVPPRLLLPAIKAGLSKRSNRPVLQQWTDFVSAITPIYRHALSPLLLPLNQGVCALVRSAIANLEDAYSANGTQEDATCETSETDVVMLLAMSERVLLQSLEQQVQASGADGASTTSSSGGGGGGGEKAEVFSFMGALSNVFSTEPTNDQTAGSQGSNAVWKSLHQTVMTLHLAWLSSGERTVAVDDSRLDTLEVVRQNIRMRCKRYLERLYRHHSGEVVEALVACWHLAVNETDKKRSDDGAETAFEVLSFLAPSAQIVITFLCDVIATRISSPSSSSGGEKSAAATGSGAGKHMSSPGVPDVVLQAFLEAYLSRLDATATAQVWPVVTIFVKDIVSNSAQRKAQIYPTLRCLTIIGEIVMDESNTTDDRRMKRDLVEHYVRICDLSILIAGRSFEQTTWIGRRTVTSDREQEDEGGNGSNEKQMSASIADLSATSTSSIDELIQVYLTERVLPALRAFALDTDKLAGLSTNMVYYIIAPALRPKRKSADVNSTVVSLLLELTKTPGTFKTWRTAVAEFFSDSRFFDMDVVAGGQRWTPIVLALMTHDKERFVETIGRVSTPSTNIFTNREAETRMRTMNIRRMTYVIFAAPKDYWLTQLPLIQEKLVDVLRNGGAAAIDPAVGEVYLCLRVLLMRFASRHLSGFWPVVITEMMRLFEGCAEELPADGSDALALVDAACRFLDLLVTLQTDEFQVHQWLFITDTVDIVYPPDDWASEAILDRLATVIGERRAARSAHAARSSSPAVGASSRSRPPRSQGAAVKDRGPSDSSLAALSKTSSSRRKPFLWQDSESVAHGEEPLSRIEELQPFFANISLHAFESTYASGDVVDLDVIETMLKHALFSGASASVVGGEEE